MKILLSVDHDAQYRAVLDALDWLKNSPEGRDEVLVAHVVATFYWGSLRQDDAGWSEAEKLILEKVDDFLAKTAQQVRDRGYDVELLRLEGDVAAELMKACNERSVDVLVAGALGQAGSRDFLVGAVAEKLESLSETDLLLVRAGDMPPGDELKALIAIDDTDASDEAARAFADKCRIDRAQVELVHVMQAPQASEIPPALRERADRAVARTRAILGPRGIEAKVTMRRGDPAREILDAAASFDSSLIVLGRGYPTREGAGGRGTVTERVARHCPRSVFIAARQDVTFRNAGGEDEREGC